MYLAASRHGANPLFRKLEGCGCFRGLFGLPRKTPGKSWKNCWKNVPESQQNATKIIGFRPKEKLKGDKLKGKIVSALFHTFLALSTHFHTFSEYLRTFPPELFLRIKGFYYCFFFVERDEKRIKENKNKKTKPFRTLVVARLSSSDLGTRKANLLGTLA